MPLQEGARLTPATILIVDDRATNRDYLVTLLGYGGHRLLQASDGMEALTLAKAERPDLVITDILMPTMDGFEFVRRLRSEPSVASVPVIFLTAHYHEQEARTLGAACGVCSVITKPAEPEAVLQAVEAALGLTPAAAPPPPEEDFDREHLRVLTDKLSEQTNELRVANQRLSALIDLQLQLGSELDVQRLLVNFGHAAREIVGARYAITGILDEEALRLKHVFTSGMDAGAAVRLGSPDPGNGLLAAIVHENRSTRLTNPGGDPKALGLNSSHPRVQAWLGVPIASPSRVFGYLGLIDRIGRAEFSEEDQKIAEILASLLGRVYQNGALYTAALRHNEDMEREILAREQAEQKLEERVRQALLVGHVGAALTRGQSLDEMLRLCAEGLIRHLDVALARIWVLNRGQNVLELRASAGLYTHLDGKHSRIPVGSLKIGTIAKNRRAHFTNRVPEDPAVTDREWAKSAGIVSFAGYPLVVEDQLEGVIGMFSRNPMSLATLDTIGVVARHIALGIGRRRLEEQIRLAQQRLRDVVVSSPAILYTLEIADDRVQGISWTSDNLQSLLGYPVEAALGPDWWLSNIHPEDRERVVAQTHDQLFSLGHTSHEYRFRRGDGDYSWIRGDLRLIRHDTDKASEAVGAMVDVSEQKRAEEEQSSLRKQLEQSQKMESIGRLAGGVAHDFNNLLTVINGYSSLLLETIPAKDPMRESLAEIEKAGLRAAELSRQLLVLSRKNVVQQKVVNLNAIITDLERMMDRVIGEDVRLQTALDVELGHIRADPDQLHQVVLNLAVNARDAMPNGGTLLIETKNVEIGETYASLHLDIATGPYVQLRVTDTGTGMTKEVMARLFEPFFTTKREGEGTGLGLAIVYGIVKQCNGAIRVYSELGEGTSFGIYFPRVDETASAPDVPKAVLRTLRGTETVLVVEDQVQLRTFTSVVLQNYGYKVLEAASPAEAILHTERHPRPIHLLLTDMVMPGMSGKELAERLKPLRPNMSVIFMSGYSERAMNDRGLLTEPRSYLAKPFSPSDLVTRVREVLGSPKHHGTVVVVDDEPGIRNYFRKILSSAGYQVEEAQDGKQAVKVIRQSGIDLAIVDLVMPEQEGLETIRALHREYPELRIIAMSGRFVGSALDAAKAFGAHAALAKPVQAELLLDTVAGVLQHT